MLVRIPPQDSVSEIVGYLKGKNSLMIFEKHATLKYKYGNRHFWYCGYYVDTVGKNTAAIIEYLQLSEIATYHKEEKTLVFILYKIISTAKILKKTIEYTTYEMGKYV